MNSELDDVDVRGTIVAVLLATEDRDEIAGALGAIAWLGARRATFPAPPAALLRVIELDRAIPTRRSARSPRRR